MNSWFQMSKSNFLCLCILIFLCVFSFLPFNSSSQFYGVALFGWAQGMLMFIAPIITILLVILDNKSRR